MIAIGKKYKNKKTNKIYIVGHISNGNVYLYSKDLCVGYCPVEKVQEYYELIDDNTPTEDNTERISHPSHYTWLKDLCGVEVIDITRHMDFCLGNAIKYILRAGRKQEIGLTDNQKEIEDLKKAIFYIKDRIKQLGGEV